MNCSRMNVDCESSFHTNFRIRISTPTGQASLENKSPAGTTGRTKNPPPTTAASRPAEDLETTLWPPQVFQDSLPHHGPEFYPDIQTPTVPSVYHQEAQCFDSLLFPDTWDFGTPSPSSPIPDTLPFTSGIQPAGLFINSAACFDASIAGMPELQNTAPAFSCEADSLLNMQHQGDTAVDWWAGGQQRW